MTDRLAELGALQYAVENLSTAGTNPNRLGLAGYIHAAYTDYQTWAAANPGANPNRLSARGRLYGYFYDHASWSPLSLFASSEVGAWYDPSDLTTMFQDRAGTTPVTADGQTVGLILDKSKGLALGAELAVNGDFNSGTGWTLGAGWTVSGGKLNASTAQYTRAWYNVAAGAFVTGKTYKIEFDVSGYVAGTFLAFLSDSGGAKEGQCYFISTGNGHKICYIRATSTVSGFGFEDESGSPPNFSIDNASVKELPGNHAVAPSDAARPLYKTDGTYHWLQFDGVDDYIKNTTASVSQPATYSIGTRPNTWASNKYFYDGGTLDTVMMYQIYGTPQVKPYAGVLPASSFNIPVGISSVVTNIYNGASSASRCNGVQVLSETFGSSGCTGVTVGANGFGTGNLGGNIYSLIVRGALSTTQEITATETWVNGKTGAY